MEEHGCQDNTSGTSLQAFCQNGTDEPDTKLTLNKRAGRIAERVVNSSLMPPTIRRTSPTTNKAIVLASDPLKRKEKPGNYSALTPNGWREANDLQLVWLKLKPMSKTNDSCNQADKTNEIEFGDLVTKWTFLVRVEIEEDEQKHCCETASRPGDLGQVD
jgi:hypothetical protein